MAIAGPSCLALNRPPLHSPGLISPPSFCALQRSALIVYPITDRTQTHHLSPWPPLRQSTRPRKRSPPMSRSAHRSFDGGCRGQNHFVDTEGEVHEAILSMASPVFERMFSSPDIGTDVSQGSPPVINLAENSAVFANDPYCHPNWTNVPCAFLLPPSWLPKSETAVPSHLLNHDFCKLRCSSRQSNRRLLYCIHA